jgi:hypothetical protein
MARLQLFKGRIVRSRHSVLHNMFRATPSARPIVLRTRTGEGSTLYPWFALHRNPPFSSHQLPKNFVCWSFFFQTDVEFRSSSHFPRFLLRESQLLGALVNALVDTLFHHANLASFCVARGMFQASAAPSKRQPPLIPLGT